MKCKKCGAEMLGEIIMTDPPVHSERCPQCGYREENREENSEAISGATVGKTDWCSVRNQAAIAIMQATLSNDSLRETIVNNGKENGTKAFDNIIEFAISGAIGLVEKLKEEDNVYEQK